MPLHMLIAFLAEFLAMAVGVFITDGARRTLTPTERLQVTDALSPLRKWVLVPFLAVILMIYEKPTLSWMVWSFVVCIATFTVLKLVLVRRGNIADAYRRATLIEARVAFAGLLAFLAAAFWPTYGA